MRSFPEKNSQSLEAALGRSFPAPCWEIMRCVELHCPAYANGETFCWRLSNTCCKNHHHPGENQCQSCLVCPVFKLHAESSPCGWNEFVAAEMSYLVEALEGPRRWRQDQHLDILLHLPRGLLIVDESSRIFFANPAAEKLTGCSARDLVGKGWEALCCGDFNETGLRVEKSRRDEAGDGVIELEISRPDGSVIPVLCRTSLLHDGSGAVIGKMHVLEDTSHLKRLQEDLDLLENKYRRLFEGTKDMIFIHSKGSIFKDVNQASVEMLGYESKEELLSLASVERIYVNPMHRRVFQEQIDRYGYVKDFETSFKKKDGTTLHCLVSGNAVRDPDGKIIGYEAISKDITARMDGVRNLRQQHRELSLLHSVAVAMNITHELDEILLTALKKVLEVLNLDAGAIFLINHEKSAFVLKVQQGLPDRVVSYSFETVLCDQALMHSLLKEDRSLKPQRTFPPFKATLNAADGDDSLQLLCFLITAKDRASGFIALEVPENQKITARDHQMLGSLGNFLGSAVEKACLMGTIRQHREELRGLTARLFHSQEEERKRIARELHDEAGQALTGINFTLETIVRDLSPEVTHLEERLQDIKKQINRTYQEMRRISHRLHPALLTDLGLEPALEYCLGRISQYSHIGIHFRMVGFEERMDPRIETVLYRISQEAINNTLKHSEAKHFKLSIIKSYPNIIFLAEDDGVGFDPDHLDENRQALGLLGMRERASMVGGKFSIRSAKGKGARIRVEIPIKECLIA